MSRDPMKLHAFRLADQIVIDLYRATARFPIEERYGLQSQLRRGAVSVVANLVEGSARRSARDYLHFVRISIGSASQVRYLLHLVARLGFMEAKVAADLARRCGDVVRALQSLTTSLSAPEA
jgi:four helix bundle protein